MQKIIGALLTAIAVTVTIAGCETDTVSTGTSQSGTSTVRESPAATTSPAAPTGGNPQGGNPQGGNPTAGNPVSGSPGQSGGPATGGQGRCLDVNSAVVADAIGSLGASPGGEPYVVERATDAALGSCPALLWALAATPRGTASSPWHVLFFDGNGYLGTATSRATAYTQVIGSSDRAVQVQYKWLRGADANCCPSGGPVVVTFTLGAGGGTVSPSPAVPDEVANPASTGSSGCPVTKDALREALRGTDIESRLEQPVELDDRITCADGWSMAHNGSRGGARQGAQILFRHGPSGWQPLDIGSAIPCVERGVPEQVVDKVCH